MTASVAEPSSSDDPQPIMSVEQVSMQFPVHGGLFSGRHHVHAVDQISFSLTGGRTLALVGESGSGKSTVARVLSALYQATSGTIRLHGRDVTRLTRGDRRRYRSDVQMIFQDPFASLNPAHPVGRAIERALSLHTDLGREQRRRRMLELLESVDLRPGADYASSYPHELSGGQRQRVNIATALAVSPRVLLADEPVSMLDVSIRIGVLNLLRRLSREQQIAMLFITHDLASANYVADETIVLYGGHLMEKTTTSDLLRTPLHPYTRLLVDSVPDPTRPARRIEARGEIPTFVDPAPGCRFAARCPMVRDLCRQTTPEVTEPEPGRLVRCHATQPSNASTFGTVLTPRTTLSTPSAAPPLPS